MAIRRAQGKLQFADMHVPDSAPRAWLGWLRELWQGARRCALRSALPQLRPEFARTPLGYKLPCESAQRGGACRWDGSSRANGAAGALVPAMPPDFFHWMAAHTHTTHADMARSAARALLRAICRLIWRSFGAHSALIAHLTRARWPVAAPQLRCGWSFRGVFAASGAAIRKHPPAFYANLEAQLGVATFPVAGMYMERMWRRVFLCSRGDARAAARDGRAVGASLEEG